MKANHCFLLTFYFPLFLHFNFFGHNSNHANFCWFSLSSVLIYISTMEINQTNLQPNINTTLPKELLAVYIPINILIIVSNVLVVVAFCKICRRGQLRLQHLFLIGLAGTDIAVFVLNTIGAVMLSHGNLQLNKQHCDALGITSTSLTAITTCIHCAMCLDRIARVRLPMNYKDWIMDRRCHCFIIVFIALGCYVTPVLVLLAVRYFGKVDMWTFEPDIPDCTAPVNHANSILGLMSVILLSGLSLLQIITGVITMKTVVSLKSTRSKVIKSFRTVCATILAFYICFVPGGIWVIWSTGFVSGYPPRWLKFVSVQMLALNSCLSFVIYYKLLPGFKSVLLNR